MSVYLVLSLPRVLFLEFKLYLDRGISSLVLAVTGTVYDCMAGQADIEGWATGVSSCLTPTSAQPSWGEPERAASLWLSPSTVSASK